MPLLPIEEIGDFADFGVRAFTTRRDAGSFSFAGDESEREIVARWTTLQREIADEASALVTGRQEHGTRVLEHSDGSSGLVRAEQGDGHVTSARGVALAVTSADCVPVFLAHPSGAVGLLHAGWRGTAGRITDEAMSALVRNGLDPAEVRAHLGPAICGRCYEVGADVREQLTGLPATRGGHVDLRALLAEQLRALGVRSLSASYYCTRCDNDRFFSHRAGDSGRHVSVIVAAK